MKKYIFALLMTPLMAFSQNEKTNKMSIDLSKYKGKEITIIGYKPIGPNAVKCPVKAVKITVEQVAIDTCYNLMGKEFTNDIVQSLDDNPFYIKLLKISKKEILNIQSELENFKDDKCDESPTPYIIIITNKRSTEIYGLKRFLHCYPGKSKDFMEKIGKLINSIN